MTAAGGCQCGAVRYRVRALGRAYACHCTECRRQSAAAFGLSVPVRWADVAATGDVAEYHRPAGTGAVTACTFCPACGVRLWHRSTASPAQATLKGGTLDAPPTPDAHLWISRKAPWIVVPPGDERFETQPRDLAQWRAGRLPPAG